ncbi:uncharacterized protein AB675_10674 [Cyphellophora attinorum]|uniref:Uncharacterized protein n=1 Tax=Cyphellophora attinorum TaxID=1664694 RepID=A0A0N0NMR2_9EURO|nr:uncharacterized protein AB675_10674 [Phialophora attinorum]KPI40648.1 hypothetical protein AB675_10674 [Phialophora attinorum]
MDSSPVSAAAGSPLNPQANDFVPVDGNDQDSAFQPPTKPRSRFANSPADQKGYYRPSKKTRRAPSKSFKLKHGGMSALPPAEYNLQELLIRNNPQLKGTAKADKSVRGHETPVAWDSVEQDGEDSLLSVDTEESNSGANTTIVPDASSATSNTPQYGQALVWKSERVKAQEEYQRVRSRVKPIAPEMFKKQAYPSGQPAGVFPQNTTEWMEFKSDGTRARLNEVTLSLDQMQAQLNAASNMNRDGIGKEKRVILPAFGNGPGQKSLADEFSTVLSQPSIWSSNAADAPQSDWPSQAELLEHGDQRGYDQFGNRVNRSLPPPRVPATHSEMSFQEQNFVRAHPLDQVGPYYYNQEGRLANPHPDAVEEANDKMNNDPIFEANAMHFLGSALMDEIGRYKRPKVPDWQEKERRQKAELYSTAYGANFGPRPGVFDSIEAMTEQETRVRRHAAANGVPALLSWRYHGPDIFDPNVSVFVEPDGTMKRYDHLVGWVDPYPGRK